LAHVPAVVTNTAAPYAWNASTQTLNIPQVPAILNGQLVQGDGTAAEQIPDFWRVGLGATGALPDGTTDVTDVIAHQSDIFVGLDALMRVGHGAGNIASNTAVGNSTLNANTTGAINVAVGFGSMATNTTGYQNTGVGYFALNKNTTGYNNVATGAGSIGSNTTGHSNSAFGNSSLTSNISGNLNASFGISSLRNNTTGSFNVAIGANSLFSNTTGIGNSAIGYQTLNSNTIGLHNLANGYQSMYSNTTGSHNIANGYFSLYNNTTGDNNISSAIESSFRNISGDDNISLGVQSLFSNTIGSGNISIGRQTSFSANNTDNNVAIGHLSSYSNVESVNNAAYGFSSLYYSQEEENTAIGSQSFDSFNSLGSAITITPLSSTRVSLSLAMSPSPAVGSYIKIHTPPSYTNSISGFQVKSYRVVNDTTLEVIDTTQVLGLTGSATNAEIRQSKGYTNSTAAGFNAEPYVSNQVALGDNRVTTTVFGDKIAFDLVAINAAPIGTTLKITGTTTGGHGGTVKIIGV
jgi:hypothetical protein